MLTVIGILINPGGIAFKVTIIQIAAHSPL